MGERDLTGTLHDSAQSASKNLCTRLLSRQAETLTQVSPFSPPFSLKEKEAGEPAPTASPRRGGRGKRRASRMAAAATSAGARESSAPARGGPLHPPAPAPLHPGPGRWRRRRAGVTWLLPFRLWPAGRGRLLARRVEPRAGSPSSPLPARATKEFADAG